MHSRILLLQCMTPDVRLFDRLLPLVPGAVVVPWIEPRKGESIRQYAERLAGQLSALAPREHVLSRSESRLFVCVVSFGGIVARELAHVISARGCILVSSVRHAGGAPAVVSGD